MTDIRSKYCVFVSHCILAQGIMADGIVKYFPGPIKPILQLCLDNDINIMQMPCPEATCKSGGLGRIPRGKKWYEKNGLRKHCETIAKQQVEYMAALEANGFKIIAIIGVDFSPACAVNYLNKGRSIHRDEGIYIEELKSKIKTAGMDIKLIGISQRWHKKMVIDFQEAMELCSFGPSV